MDDFGIYVILTKPVLPYTQIAEICVENKIKMLQLREKHLTDKQLLSIAKDLRCITGGTETKLVINDRPDIAMLCSADYLHLGQDDIDIEYARSIVGDIKVGVSTHSIQQVVDTLKKQPDYIGFGPVFATNAKAIPDPPVGLDLLAEAIGISSVPVVAIGGIFPENVQDIIRAGARNMAFVRYFMQAESCGVLKKRLREITALLDPS